MISLGGAISCLIFSGRARQESAAEFRYELQSVNSAYWSQLIGTTKGRAYIERTSAVELLSIIGLGPTV